jgi:hypothetical protein
MLRGFTAISMLASATGKFNSASNIPNRFELKKNNTNRFQGQPIFNTALPGKEGMQIKNVTPKFQDTSPVARRLDEGTTSSAIFGGTEDDFIESLTTNDNGITCLVGETESFGNSKEAAFITMINPDGTSMTQVIDGDGDDTVKSVITLSDNRFAFAGEAETDSTSEQDVLIGFADESGIKKIISYGGSDDDSAATIVQLNTGDIVAAGDIWGTGEGLNDALYIKTTNEGVLTKGIAVGADNIDTIFSTHVTKAGNIIAVGTTSSYDKETRILVHLLNANLELKKSFTISGRINSDPYSLQGFSVKETDNGNYVIAGISQWDESDSTPNMMITIVTPEGVVKCMKSISGSKNSYLLGVIQTSPGNFLASGKAYVEDSTDAVFVKFTETCEISSIDLIGGPRTDSFATLTQKPNGDIIAGGYSYSFSDTNSALGEANAFIMQYNPNNTIQCTAEGLTINIDYNGFTVQAMTPAVNTINPTVTPITDFTTTDVSELFAITKVDPTELSICTESNLLNVANTAKPGTEVLVLGTLSTLVTIYFKAS